MKEKEKYIIKDSILESVTAENHGGKTISEISESLKIPFHIVCTLTDDLIGEGFVSALEIATRKSEWRGDKILSSTQKGFFFFREEGGFKSLHSAKNWATITNRAKRAIIALHAILILSIAYWNVKVAQNSAKTEKELNKRDSIITELNTQIEKYKIQKVTPDTGGTFAKPNVAH